MLYSAFALLHSPFHWRTGLLGSHLRRVFPWQGPHPVFPSKPGNQFFQVWNRGFSGVSDYFAGPPLTNPVINRPSSDSTCPLAPRPVNGVFARAWRGRSLVCSVSSDVEQYGPPLVHKRRNPFSLWEIITQVFQNFWYSAKYYFHNYPNLAKPSLIIFHFMKKILDNVFYRKIFINFFPFIIGMFVSDVWPLK